MVTFVLELDLKLELARAGNFNTLFGSEKPRLS